MDAISTRVCVWLLMLSCAACSSADPSAVALIVAYRGPTDKYVPCLILSDAQHNRSAVALGEKLDCRAFVAIVGTTNDSDFFVQVDELTQRPPRQVVPLPILFVALDRADHRTEVELDVAEGVSKVRALAKYFPNIQERIETEFARRVEPRDN